MTMWALSWSYLSLGLLGLLLLVERSFKRRAWISSLEGKHAFITGGSSGIGLAIAECVVEEGGFVTLVSRNAETLASAAERLRAKQLQLRPNIEDDRIRYEVADVGDYLALAGALERAFEWLPVVVLVCNAGLTRGGYLGSQTWS
ncbi:hypothetical protein L7F22_027964 [Adiantum nelumboides]|nr:hypothetical protein [Adiantum nelumboides]